MTVPVVENLRADKWRTLSPEAKLWALGDLERGLAEQEDRNACPVQFISPAELAKAREEGRKVSGYYSDKDRVVYINPDDLSEGTQPYEATDTLFHESRHAYQHHIVENPEKAPEQAEQWQWNLQEGYVPPSKDRRDKLGSHLYRFQPVEDDANEVALRRNIELYGEQFQDPAFEQWRAETEYREAQDRESAHNLLGPEYVSRAEGYAHDQFRRRTEQQSLESQPRESEGAVPGALSRPEAEELGEEAGERAGQVAGEAAAGPAGAAAGEAAGRETGRATGEAAEEASERAGLSVEPPADAVQETAEEASETGAQSDEAQVDAAQEAADEAPTAPSEQEEDRDYDYGYGYGY